MAAAYESEKRTRRERIDPILKAEGWKIVPFVKVTSLSACKADAITEYPTKNGPADYALAVDGVLLGVVEAKKVSLGAHGVLTQAERYAKGIEDSPFDFGGCRVPFLYSTNGEEFWFWDVRDKLNTARKVSSFHTPSALKETLSKDFKSACTRLKEMPNEHSRLRPYQVEANTAIEEAMANRKRLMLVAMATGTGKTFTMVNQVYRLMKSGVARRVLFLVDRRALAAQAVRAFASFEPEPNKKFDKIYEVYSQRFQREDFGSEDKFDPKLLPKDYLTDPQPKHTFLYISTIQRMAINLFGRSAVWSGEADEIDDDADEVTIPIHAFDVIVADECHRGYTTAELSLWRNTLEHFDAIKIGLTATPAAHTKAYFNDIVYRYEYSRAVREGFLVDYDVVSISSNVRMKGIFLKKSDQIELIDVDTGSEKMDQLEDERDFDSTEVERTITAPESNKKILQEIKKHAEEHEKIYKRFPKTLIFAVNDIPHTSHADQLVEQAVAIFKRGESFVRKITGRVDRPLQAIREFRNLENPGIVVTVDLLSTGVDIPDLEYIIFLRPVKSRILFEQMLGRGTRKGEKFTDKSHFTVFDCFDGTLVAYFKGSTAITADPPTKPSRTFQEIIKDIWDNKDREYNIRCLTGRLQRIDKEMDGDARVAFEANGIEDGDVKKFAANLAAYLHKDFKGTMAILRASNLQDLLVNYSRRKRTFIVASGYEDEVTSKSLIGGLKPDDYLIAFSKFVNENSSKIEAIKILMSRPKGWGTDALDELKKKLSTTPERFTIENLQMVHDIHYHKALVDVISMVKHAAKEKEPLLTAEERVQRAIDRLTAGRKFTPEAQAWLVRIREHMIVNLSISKDAFEWSPVLDRAGGWQVADKDFAGGLMPLVESLNEAVAS
jgi:type I restriction enzyme R subunit